VVVISAVTHRIGRIIIYIIVMMEIHAINGLVLMAGGAAIVPHVPEANDATISSVNTLGKSNAISLPQAWCEGNK